jgi:hypothetical protein
MQNIAFRLENIINEHIPALREIPDDIFSLKPNPAKWSKKEIIGHLVDSAQSNIRRFVVAQYEDEPYIVYDQDKWVATMGYQQWDPHTLVMLWYLLNQQICAILRNTPPAMYQRQSRSQELHTIEWLAEDYVKHLLHHLHVVLELEPVTYP